MKISSLKILAFTAAAAATLGTVAMAQSVGPLSGNFRPVFASSVSNVTADTLADEEYQISYAVEYLAALDQIEIAKIRSEQNKSEFERAKALVQGPSLSRRDFVRAKDKYEMGLHEITRLQMQAEFTKAMATVYRLRTTRAAEPTREDLKAEVEARLVANRAKLAGMKASLSAAEILRASLEGRANHGKELLEKDSTSLQDYETRLFNARSSAQSVEGVKAQIKIIEGAIESLETTLKRL